MSAAPDEPTPAARPEITEAGGTSSTPAPAISKAMRRTQWVTFLSYFWPGLVFSAWMSRLPAVRDALDLTASQLGRIMFVASLGSIAMLPIAGAVTARIGVRRAVFLFYPLIALGYAAAAGLTVAGTMVAVASALFVVNIGFGLYDVAVNVHGANVDRASGEERMPQFHGGFSLGTVTGAGLGALASALHVPIHWHVGVLGALTVPAVWISLRWFLPDAPTRGAKSTAQRSYPRYSSARAWRERRTWALGVVLLGIALTEGAAADWLALASIEAFGISNAWAAVGYGIFVVGMTSVRFAGTALVARVGRVWALRLSFALALAGVSVFVLSPWVPLAFVAALAWGAGSALGFPLALAAAGDDPMKAAATISAVSTLGYGAFLVGPPLMGELAEHIGYRPTLAVLALPVAIGLFFSGAARPLPAASPRGSD
ncbi:MFS transporter [Buchananella felis]|uniref:MFS transporter n=1 Tax=Buchananella felis TaxID=3231492 RepID=UPI0035288A71